MGLCCFWSYIKIEAPLSFVKAALFCGCSMQEKISSFLTYLTSCLLALTGMFSIQDWAAIIGVIMVFITYFTNRRIKLKMLDEIRRRPVSEELYEKISQ